VFDAIYGAVGAGVRLTRHSDASPVDVALRDPIQAVVHPVLDVPGGRALRRPGDLPARSVSEGTPAAVVRLLEQLPGDVVAVLDGVRLLHGPAVAAKAAAAFALTLTGVAGLGVTAAPAVAAAPVARTAATTTSSTRTSTRAGTSTEDQRSPGVVLTTSGGHNGTPAAEVGTPAAEVGTTPGSQAPATTPPTATAETRRKPWPKVAPRLLAAGAGLMAAARRCRTA
jgi:hypothetical protein